MAGRLGVVVAVVFLAGCSGYSGAADPVVDSQQMNQQLAPAFCSRIEQCDPDRLAAAYGGQQGCIDAYLRDAAGAKSDSALQSQVDACKQQIAKTSCDVVMSDKIDCAR